MKRYAELIGDNKSHWIKSQWGNILSGAWEDFKFSTPQNQKKCILPMNDVSTTLFYDQRIVLSADIEEPVVWICTKVEQIGPKGISRLTFAQDKWDQNRDYVERDEDGKVIGMWADYYKCAVTPEDVPLPNPPVSEDYAVIEYAGKKPQMKVGGSYKKFSVLFYRDEEPIEYKQGAWSFVVDGSDISAELATLTSTDSSDLNENEIKVKLPNDPSYIGKIMTVSFESEDGTNSTLDVEIIAL